MMGSSDPRTVFFIDRCPEDDATLITDDAGMAALRSAVLELTSSQRPNVLLTSFRLDLERFWSAWQSFYENASRSESSVGEVREALEARVGHFRERLKSLMETEVDPAVKEEVYQELLSRLERIDILHYPRKILALPLVGAKKLLGQFFPVFGDRDVVADAGSVWEFARP